MVDERKVVQSDDGVLPAGGRPEALTHTTPCVSLARIALSARARHDHVRRDPLYVKRPR